MDSDSDLLYSFAVENPEFTYVQACDKFYWNRTRFYVAVRGVRRALKDDRINLVCTPSGGGKPWVYKLVGSYEDSRVWSGNRLADSETRLSTMQSVAESIVSATSPTTPDGRKARIIAKGVSRILEDVHDLNEYEEERSG